MSNTFNRKHLWKPGKSFKKPRRKWRRSQEKQIFKDGIGVNMIFPRFKKDDVWDYN